MGEALPEEVFLSFKPDGEVLDEYYGSWNYSNVCIGPLGSGKTICSIYKVFDAICEQPISKDGVRRSRWITVRNTANDLESTTIKDWFDIVPEELGHFHQSAPMTHYMDFIGDDGVPVLSEMIFLPLDMAKAIRKLRGQQLTGIWFNEMKELLKAIVFLGLSRTGRYPAQQDMPPIPGHPHLKRYWNGGVGDTNAPDDDHWLYELYDKYLAGELKRWNIFKQPGGVIWDPATGLYIPNPKAENLNNLHGGYYTENMDGASDDYIKVNLANEFGMFSEGAPVHPEYKDQIHSADDFDYIPGLQVHIGADFGRCYDDKTEVLTFDGWKYFKDVDAATDLAATRNPVTGAFEYTKINFKVDQPHNADMITMENKTISMCVTPEHRIPITFRTTPKKVHFKTAQWVMDHQGGHHYVDVTSKWTGVDPDTILGYDAEWFAYFLGVFMTDGCLEKDTDRLTITQAKQPNKDQLTAFLGPSWTESRNSFRFTDKKLAGYIRGLGALKKDRKIPDEIKLLSPRLLKRFIAGMVFGDGHVRRKNNSEETTLYTAHKHIADAVQEIAQKIGWHSAIRVQKGQNSRFSDGRLVVSGDGYVLSFKKGPQRAELQLTKITKGHYPGRRYCLNVPYNTLYVRRNGKAHWNGNTPSAVMFQIVNGGYQIFDEFPTRDIGATTFAPELKLYLAQKYKITKNVTGAADPAGDNATESSEQSAIAIMRQCGFDIHPSPIPNTDLTRRRKAMTDPLKRMRNDGRPAFLVHKRCKVLRQGLNGKFYYRRLAVSYDEKHTSQPEKNWHSHTCFAPGTMISTPTGDQPIEDLNVGDVVITPAGPYPISAKWSREAERCELLLQGQRHESIVCTPDHRFWTQHGFVEAGSIPIGEPLACANRHWQDHYLHHPLRKKRSTQYLNSMECGSIVEGVLSIITARKKMMGRSICNKLFGLKTTATFPMEWRYTTKTTTERTTIQKTSKCSRLPSTRSSTCASPPDSNIAGKRLKAPRLRLLNGVRITLERLAKSGLRAWQASASFGLLQPRLPFSATIVPASFQETPLILKKQDWTTAVENASQLRVEPEGTTTLHGSASSAVTGLPSTGIKKPNHVALSARKPYAPGIVIGITVDVEHSYYANGVLVSNCEACEYAMAGVGEGQIYQEGSSKTTARTRRRSAMPRRTR